MAILTTHTTVESDEIHLTPDTAGR